MAIPIGKVVSTFLKKTRSVRRRILECLLPRPTEGVGRFRLKSDGVKLRVHYASTSKMVFHGDILVQSDLGDRGEVYISLGAGARFEVKGDLILGPGVMITVNDGAKLIVGGKQASSGSGITCNTRIMVNQSVEIGFDCIIAWDVFVTDCDWHQIDGKAHTVPVKIGDRVWIGQGATILKGTSVGAGSIIGSKSLLVGRGYPSGVVVVGNPARVACESVRWSREMTSKIG